MSHHPYSDSSCPRGVTTAPVLDPKSTDPSSRSDASAWRSWPGGDPVLVDLTGVPSRLGVSALKCLFLIANWSLTMTQLSRRLGVSTAAMTGTVDTLVKFKLAARKAHPDDRRMIVIVPTRAGQKLAERIFHHQPQA